MDKKSAQNLQTYAKNISNMLDSMTPWQKRTSRNAHLRGKVKPGEVAVILDGGENLDQNFIEGATVIRE